MGPTATPSEVDGGLITHIRDPSVASGDDAVRLLESDSEAGLSSRTADQRLARYGPNRLQAEAEVPAWRKFLDQFADPLIYLLLAAIAVSVVAWALEGATGWPIEAIVIAAIVLGNGILGYLQERQAERAMAALQGLTAPTAVVIRDGQPQRVAGEALVPGDILVLGEGDTVSADARLLRASSLTVSEAALTGESEPVLKDPAPLPGPAPIAERFNMVFSGTAVTRGRGRAIVTATGMRSELGRVAELLGQTTEERTPLQREVALIGRFLGLAVIGIAVIVITAVLVTTRIDGLSTVVEVLLLGVSLAVAAVPEGLAAILTVVLALGVQRMARQRALVRRLSSVETLGSASVICTDKTGTLTRNEMTIIRVVTHSGEVVVSGAGYQPEGDLTTTDGRPLAGGALRSEVRAVLGGGSLAGNASLEQHDGEWVIRGDPTEAAFLVAERKLGSAERRAARFTRHGEIPFSSERKRMSTIEADMAHAGQFVVMAKGAPDLLLPRCSRERVGRGDQPLTEHRRAVILADVERLAGDALRTLAVAYRPLHADAPPAVDESLEENLVFAGLVGMIDPPRVEVADAIDEAKAAGVRVVMITGDHARTAGRIAADLGIGSEAGGAIPPRSLSGRDLDAMDDPALQKAASTTSVYARVSPEHKLRIVDALQASNLIVAMTGDGVNDAPALRSADIGVAMGITGTDVAKEAANMVLADDNFATIVAAVREGRAIFDNIRRFLRYLLSSNAGEVLAVFLGVVGASVIGLDGAGGLAVPLLATQILWINLLTDSAPALALAFEPAAEDIMRRPPRRLTDPAIDRPMQLNILYIEAVMAVATLLTIDWRLPGGLIHGAGSLDEARTMGFTVLVLAQLFNGLNARASVASAFHRPFGNVWLLTAIGLSLLLQVLVVHLPVLNAGFGTTPLSLADWSACVAIASSVLWADELRKFVGRQTSRRGGALRTASSL